MPIPAPARSTDTTPALLADLVYDRVLALVVSGELAPGEVLREIDIAAWLDVSRTPVREAMRRLSVQGLVVYRPNRDSSIAPLVATQLLEIVQTAAALYGMAARLAYPHLSADDVARLRSVMTAAAEATAAESGVEKATHVHAALHVLLDRSGNAVLRAQTLALDPHLQRLLGAVPGHVSTATAAERAAAVVTALSTGGAELVGQTFTGYYLAWGSQVVEAATERGLTV